MQQRVFKADNLKKKQSDILQSRLNMDVKKSAYKMIEIAVLNTYFAPLSSKYAFNT